MMKMTRMKKDKKNLLLQREEQQNSYKTADKNSEKMVIKNSEKMVIKNSKNTAGKNSVPSFKDDQQN